MNILITRPLIDAEDLMGKLFSLGHKIIHIPTLKIIPAKYPDNNEIADHSKDVNENNSFKKVKTQFWRFLLLKYSIFCLIASQKRQKSF